MQEYSFSSDLNQKIVDGILKGYNEYIEVRKDKKRTMNISGAYAWTKGNHIEDAVSKELLDLNITFNPAKAGYTWGYLQFNHDDGVSKKMFIIKNAKYFNVEEFDRSKTPLSGRSSTKKTNYILELANANSEVEFIEQVVDDSIEQLSLFVDLGLPQSDSSVEVAKTISKEFNEFYIITYSTDEAHQISEVKQYMPNPIDKKAYLINDLSSFIGTSHIEISTIDDSLINAEVEEMIYDAQDFGIGLPAIEKDK